MTAPDLTMFFPAPRIDRNKWLRPGLMSSDSVEAYTPAVIRDAVVRTLRRVDVDPCADPGRTFPAATHYTKEDNGLARRWLGKVYMNPPYGKGPEGIVPWTTKLRDELASGWVVEAVALLPARVDTEWWHELAPPFVCLVKGRLRFGNHDQSAPFPSVAAYFGPNPDRFRDGFADLGMFYESR